jgi:hypothetical protein
MSSSKLGYLRVNAVETDQPDGRGRLEERREEGKMVNGLPFCHFEELAGDMFREGDVECLVLLNESIP